MANQTSILQNPWFLEVLGTAKKIVTQQKHNELGAADMLLAFNVVLKEAGDDLPSEIARYKKFGGHDSVSSERLGIQGMADVERKIPISPELKQIISNAEDFEAFVYLLIGEALSQKETANKSVGEHTEKPSSQQSTKTNALDAFLAWIDKSDVPKPENVNHDEGTCSYPNYYLVEGVELTCYYEIKGSIIQFFAYWPSEVDKEFKNKLQDFIKGFNENSGTPGIFSLVDDKHLVFLVEEDYSLDTVDDNIFEEMRALAGDCYVELSEFMPAFFEKEGNNTADSRPLDAFIEWLAEQGFTEPEQIDTEAGTCSYPNRYSVDGVSLICYFEISNESVQFYAYWPDKLNGITDEGLNDFILGFNENANAEGEFHITNDKQLVFISGIDANANGVDVKIFDHLRFVAGDSYLELKKYLPGFFELRDSVMDDAVKLVLQNRSNDKGKTMPVIDILKAFIEQNGEGVYSSKQIFLFDAKKSKQEGGNSQLYKAVLKYGKKAERGFWHIDQNLVDLLEGKGGSSQSKTTASSPKSVSSSRQAEVSNPATNPLKKTAINVGILLAIILGWFASIFPLVAYIDVSGFLIWIALAIILVQVLWSATEWLLLKRMIQFILAICAWVMSAVALDQITSEYAAGIWFSGTILLLFLLYKGYKNRKKEAQKKTRKKK